MAAQDHFRIETRKAPDRVVLCLHGELDLASAPLLTQEIENAGADGAAAMIVLDLKELQFIDSTGLRIVLAANERSQERGQEFALTRGSQQVQRLLSITGVGEHLRIIASPDEILV
jgi:anti-sigma B factor antagonist